MKKLLLSMLMLGIFLAACSSGDKFDAEAEKKKATEVLNGVLTSFEDQEKIAEAPTSDQANVISWDRIKEKNKNAISMDLPKEDQTKLLYLLTLNKPEDVNGKTQSNILFSQNTKIKNTSLNEEDKSFTFDIERSGFDRKLVTLEKEEETWKITKVADPE